MQFRLSTIVLFLLLSIGYPLIGYCQHVTLKEKIGQMVMIGFQGEELNSGDPVVKAIMKQEIGGVVLYDFDHKRNAYDRNIKNPHQLQFLTRQLQSYTRIAAEQQRNYLYPMLIGIDYEGGNVNRLSRKNGFPLTLSAAEIGKLSPSDARYYAKQMAHTLKVLGINLDFAPVVDVNVNPNNPVLGKRGRVFSADPKIVAKFAGIFSKAFYDAGIACSYKHFPGHGSSTGDSHYGFVDVTNTWQEYELEPYKTLISKPYACGMVMTAHVVNGKLDNQKYPASISKEITTQLLRKKLHFHGVVITDDMQMGAITSQYGTEESTIAAINAGADILLFANQLVDKPQDPEVIINMIYHDVKVGKISESKIDAAYAHVMALKHILKNT